MGSAFGLSGNLNSGRGLFVVNIPIKGLGVKGSLRKTGLFSSFRIGFGFKGLNKSSNFGTSVVKMFARALFDGAGVVGGGSEEG